MPLVIVERAFEEPQVFDALHAKEDEKAWCLELHHVRFLRSYFALDGRRMACLYEAPDAESVRRAQDQAGLPYTRAWAPDTLDGTAEEPTADDSQVRIVERTFAREVTLSEIVELVRASRWCLEMHQVERVASHMAKDGRRALCVYLAPDAEAVRKSQTLAKAKADRVWSAHIKRGASRLARS